MGSIRRAVMGAGLLLVTVLACAGEPAAATPVKLDIKSQPMADALNQWAQATGFQVIFPEESATAKLVSPEVRGRYVPAVALTKLLENSGLRYEYLNERTVSVKVAQAAQVKQSSDQDKETERPLGDARAQSESPRIGEQSSQSEGSGSQGGGREDSDKLDEIVVSGHRFLAIDTSGTTNLPLDIEKVPQSISIVSNDFIQTANLKTLGEIAEYTPGAINVGNQSGFSSNIKLRGFVPASEIDGLALASGNNSYELDYAIFDRLEIVKGPSSVVYGVSSAGGLVNFVTKSATSQTPNYLYAQAGSWNSYRVEGQIAGALDSEQRVRAIGIAVRDQGDSFVDFMDHAKTTLYGGINVNLTDSISGYVHGGYERFVRTAFDGIPTEADGTPAPLARSFFIGLKGSDLTSSVYHTEGNLDWHVTDMLELALKGNYSKSDTTGTVGYSSGLAADGAIGLGLIKYPELSNENYGVGVSSVYHLDALRLRNSFVSVGALYQQGRGVAVNLVSGGASNIFDGEDAIDQAFKSLLAGPLPRFDLDTVTKTLTVSAQSVLQLIEPVSLLLGVSYSKPDVKLAANYIANGAEQDFDIAGQVSYRAGVTYEFLPGANAYVSFSQSFFPQTYNSCSLAPGATVCSSVGVLPPLIGEQYEGGLKYRSTDGRLLLTGALFQIKEKNAGRYDQTVGGFDYWKAIGEVTHKGLEFQALGQITRGWQVNAGYAYLDPKITSDSVSTNVGQTQLFLPKQTASIDSIYTLPNGVLRGLSFGGGLRYVSAQRTAYDGSTRDLPSYTLVDATLGYTREKWLVQLNARNVFDKHYLINSYQTLYYGNVVGDPANVALSVRRQF